MADIKLVIKIPEGLKDVFENRNVTALDVEEMRRAIKNGTPLPKGHEYIDRNNAITSICQWFTTAERCRQFSYTTDLIKMIVTDILCDEPTVICADKGGEQE